MIDKPEVTEEDWCDIAEILFGKRLEPMDIDRSRFFDLVASWPYKKSKVFSISLRYDDAHEISAAHCIEYYFLDMPTVDYLPDAEASDKLGRIERMFRVKGPVKRMARWELN